ncbi:hypothetical protein LENED_008453 [Lentinula edodes]|uniref:Uncharacterized protein n=1 Tax=Lentinula edodes TaxID=5353 RepID=A0A1Q3EH51_LENED|nr:hypothetical protein LENED_008453 [Lentinula edodes]
MSPHPRNYLNKTTRRAVNKTKLIVLKQLWYKGTGRHVAESITFYKIKPDDMVINVHSVILLGIGSPQETPLEVLALSAEKTGFV